MEYAEVLRRSVNRGEYNSYPTHRILVVHILERCRGSLLTEVYNGVVAATCPCKHEAAATNTAFEISKILHTALAWLALPVVHSNNSDAKDRRHQAVGRIAALFKDVDADV